MKALVLGGGSVKGAFQAGAIRAALESGFIPDMIYGISVGALNTAFLLNSAGKHIRESPSVPWHELGRELVKFWEENIDRPQAIGLLRSRMSLGVSTLLNRYEGLLDTSPLYDLVRKKVSLENIRASKCKGKVGAVNIATGEIAYAAKEDADFLQFLFASAAIPVIMPGVEIGGDVFFDGALREVVPVREAIADGAKEIFLIACNAKSVVHWNDDADALNLIRLIERMRDITLNQVANNDISWAKSLSLREAHMPDSLKLTVIRPLEPIQLNLQKFTPADISQLLKEGYETARAVLENVLGL